jgi:hypothetical protein
VPLLQSKVEDVILSYMRDFSAKTVNEMKGKVTYLSHLAVYLLYTKMIIRVKGMHRVGYA